MTAAIILTHIIMICYIIITTNTTIITTTSTTIITTITTIIIIIMIYLSFGFSFIKPFDAVHERDHYSQRVQAEPLSMGHNKTKRNISANSLHLKQ